MKKLTLKLAEILNAKAAALKCGCTETDFDRLARQKRLTGITMGYKIAPDATVRFKLVCYKISEDMTTYEAKRLAAAFKKAGFSKKPHVSRVSKNKLRPHVLCCTSCGRSEPEISALLNVKTDRPVEVPADLTCKSCGAKMKVMPQHSLVMITGVKTVSLTGEEVEEIAREDGLPMLEKLFNLITQKPEIQDGEWRGENFLGG